MTETCPQRHGDAYPRAVGTLAAVVQLARRPAARHAFCTAKSGGGQVLESQSSVSAGADLAVHDSGTAMLRVDCLQKFPEVVTQLGGDAKSMLAQCQIDPIALTNRHAVIPHRTFVRLLERAAVELDRPDFGLRLGAAQGGMKVLGPLGYVMRNSQSVREAYHYCIAHLDVYSTAIRMCFEKSRTPGTAFLRV